MFGANTIVDAHADCACCTRFKQSNSSIFVFFSSPAFNSERYKVNLIAHKSGAVHRMLFTDMSKRSKRPFHISWRFRSVSKTVLQFLAIRTPILTIQTNIYPSQYHWQCGLLYVSYFDHLLTPFLSFAAAKVFGPDLSSSYLFLNGTIPVWPRGTVTSWYASSENDYHSLGQCSMFLQNFCKLYFRG